MTLVHKVRYRNKLWDSVNPDAIPANTHAMLYINGGFAASPTIASRFASVLWIDVFGDSPRANVLDVETSDATPGDVPAWVTEHVNLYGDIPTTLARVYCNLSTWPDVRAAVRTLSPQYRRHVRYHIAHPTGQPHLVPGSHATQWFWGHGANDYDLSEFRPDYLR